MPRPGSTQLTVNSLLRQDLEMLASEYENNLQKITGSRVNISVQTYLIIVVDKIKSGEIKL